MKVQSAPTAPHSNQRIHDLGVTADSFRISKPYKHLENGLSEAEMQACFSKLKDLVPTIPSDKKVSKVQLLQHVIDYIFDLETTLEDDEEGVGALLPASVPVFCDRKPLTESRHLNTIQCATTVVNSTGTICCTGPASC